MRRIDLNSVLCFILKDNHVLLIKRNEEPWRNRWNGVGGKIKARESPNEAVYREVQEETGIHLEEAQQVKYTGIVSWDKRVERLYRLPISESANTLGGMYVFIAFLSQRQTVWKGEQETKEGVLAWKPVQWACDKKNSEIALNVPHFLPEMFKRNIPQEYYCIFEEKEFKRIKIF